ncbi:hypothetical protein [Chondromyces apiculatus]|uniref:Uncharacterized protein n=1 Tax=Chondromyces apiculatus DSM 436 TaxID=1192034 RepID=A0A017SZJ1_9BACT|nr:hypothetical protein [Chondromyces apiculatus]EYF01721.1 Hypothetical protein CAP_7856 [Chondromyces apiculatus DSM 436]
MAAAARTVTAFGAEVAKALAALGGDASDLVIDGLADPVGAAKALSERGTKPVLLRAAPEMGAGMEGYGPTPVEPVWLRVEGSTLRLVPLRLHGSSKAETPEVARVTIEARSLPCCDAAGCDRKRSHVSAWLVLAGGAARGAKEEGSADGRHPSRKRLLVAETRGLDAARAEAQVEAFGARLARALGAPLETTHGTEPADAIAHRPLPEPDGEREGSEEQRPLDAASVARFLLRTEGTTLVLRDHEDDGPRTSATRNVIIGLVLLVLSAPLWVQVARSISAHETGIAIGVGAAAMLVSLTAYAFLGVARFSAKYVARSSPLLWLARDRVVAAPWVSRVGAIDLKPEGRFGAGIPLGELNGVHVRSTGSAWAVELDTDHGPIDVLAASSEEVARHLAVLIARAAASVRHPGGPSARQRIRARARQKAEAPGGGDGPPRGVPVR